MPEISRFFGIVIAIYYKEHGIPHFHAKYSGQTGVFSITDLKIRRSLTEACRRARARVGI
ncbi:MAG TPA: DUF4160 domain-containing protein [Pyrinomonadaceae bacterium]|jgi:hypothetical protein|nr:DUF4160 domain-containing protein [Pyrinomonadaceae bacterium]